MDDARMLKLIGMDSTLYLIFLRHTTILFFALTVIAGIFLVPIFGSGISHSNHDSMDQFTIINVTDNQNKLAFAYFVALLVVPLTAGFVIYQYS